MSPHNEDSINKRSIYQTHLIMERKGWGRKKLPQNGAGMESKSALGEDGSAWGGGRGRDRGKEFSHRKKMDESKQVEGRCRNNDEKRRRGVETG